MNKYLLLLLVTAINPLTGPCFRAVAQAIGEDSDVKRVSEYPSGELKCRDFQIEVPETGDYRACFWAFPACRADNSYVPYLIYVDGVPRGQITPRKGNWQALELDKGATLGLTQGVHTVTVATTGMAYPQVEIVNVGRTAGDAALHSQAYDSYLAEARECDGSESIVEGTRQANATAASASSTPQYFSNIPLRYSYWNTYSFEQGQEVVIKSSSPIQHSIDLAFLGTQFPAISPGTLGSTNSQGFHAPNLGTGIANDYFPATLEERQGLNWRRPSEASPATYRQEAALRVKIPKKGKYLLRLRSANHGVLGVADLNVCDSCFYEDVPVFYSHVQCIIPADSTNYTCAVTANGNYTSISDYDDPMLFIHGAAGDRIVGYIDDGANPYLSSFGGSRSPSLTQTYLIPASGVSVSSYGSYNPVSTYNIAVTPSGSVSFGARRMDTAAGMVMASDGPAQGVRLTGDLRVGGSLTVDAPFPITGIAAHDLTGRTVGMSKGPQTTVRLSEIGITSRGVYLITTLTDGQPVCEKILVK